MSIHNNTEQLYRFIKISERLPDVNGYYFVRSAAHHGVKAKGCSHFEKGKFDTTLIEEWLEEYPNQQDKHGENCKY